MNFNFAKRMDTMKASEIREILKVTEQEGFISFAGGLPAPELFPVQEMLAASNSVLAESGSQALQYATTEGFVPLREKLAHRMNHKLSMQVTMENIQIVSGSQQALDMTGKLFLDEGDVVICESPTYLGAINAFRAYGCRFVEVAGDSEGMNLIALKKVLDDTKNIKMIYVIPDFQNPTGISWSLERREEFMKLVTEVEIPVIEDNPYGELTFRGEIMPSLQKWDYKKLVISLGSFSKVLCPGLRIGWISAGVDFIERYVMIKQAMDLHTSNLSQREINKFMELYDLDAHIEVIKKVYKNRRDLAISQLKINLGEQIEFTVPEGGLFTWITLPEGMKSRELLERCIQKSVAFVPGDAFFPNGGGENTFRMNFSNATEEQLIEGIKRLSEAYMEMK